MNLVWSVHLCTPILTYFMRTVKNFNTDNAKAVSATCWMSCVISICNKCIHYFYQLTIGSSTKYIIAKKINTTAGINNKQSNVFLQL